MGKDGQSQRRQWAIRKAANTPKNQTQKIGKNYFIKKVTKKT
jgi:hypothetical protein